MTSKILSPRGAMGGAVMPVLSVTYVDVPADGAPPSAAAASAVLRPGNHLSANWLQRCALLTAIPVFHFALRAIVDVENFVKNEEVAVYTMACLLGCALAFLLQAILDAIYPALLARLHRPRALICWLVLLWLVRNFSQPAMNQYYTSTPSDQARVAALSAFAMTVFMGALVYGAGRDATSEDGVAEAATEGHSARVLVLCTIAAHFDLYFHTTGLVQIQTMHNEFGVSLATPPPHRSDPLLP